MFTLSKASRTYMKLSGAFSEMPDSLRAPNVPASQIFESLFSWLGVVLATFGPSRTMFGSDWPVCQIGGGDEAWPRWRDVVEKMCWMASLSDEERAMIWGGTAKEAYKL
jgi:L-rhamnono-1,4-lactonase